jgi:hypothetical protein
MKRIILATLVAMFTFCIASAQNDYVSSKAVKNIYATTLSCNKGTEPFSTFLKKFKTSATFRYSRIASTAKWVGPNGANTGKQAVDDIKDYLSENGGFDTYYNEDDEGYSMAKFAVITADKVVYRTEIDSMCYSLTEYVFVRTNGKWYLTKYYLSM